MEGLEITIKSKLDAFDEFYKSRIDPEFFQEHYLELDRVIRSKNHDNLGEIAFITDGEHGTAKTTPSGYSKYYGARNVLSGILNDNGVEFISEAHHKKLSKTALKPRDVLISCVGANIGFSALVPDDIGIGNIVRNVALIRSNDDYKNEYIHAYLLSKYGKALYIRINTGNAQPLVSLDYIGTVPVFKPNTEFQELIKSLMDLALESRYNSSDIYTQAETLLLKVLDLNDFVPSKEPVNIKSFNESFGSSGRLDAEYYQKKYDDFLCKLNDSSKLGFNILKYKDIASGFKYGSSTKLNYQENGVPFLRIADLNDKKFELQNLKFISKEDAINEKGASVSVNDILISRSGTLGLTVRIPKYLEGAIFGSYFVKSHLKVNINPTYITLYLNSLPGTIQIEQANTGGIQTNITIPVIENILIALPSIDFQNKIELMISESDSLKKESEQLLNLAKTAVEKAIEENEEKAINYISEKLAELKINLSNEG